MKSVFDPALAKKAAPLTRQEVAQLAQKFAEQEAAHAKALAARRSPPPSPPSWPGWPQVAAAQAAKQAEDTRDYSEAETRDTFIESAG